MLCMIRPQYLREGSRVALVATARKVSPEEIQPTVELLRAWHLEPVVDDGLYAADHQMAGSDEHRAHMLQRYIDDDSIDAILCVRGGYGTVRMVDHVDYQPLIRHPKWLIGFSDVTVLHSHIGRHCQLATLHATMPLNIPADPKLWSSPAITTLRRALFEGRVDIDAPPSSLNRNGHCEAPVVGGNLSVLYSLVGSASDIDTEGKILFIEDLDEYLYHIDRMMQNLRRCGKLEHLAGLAVGALSDMHDNTIPFGRQAEEIVLDAVSDYHYPVAFHLPVGHIGLDNHAILLGATATLDVNDQQTHFSQSC